MMFNHISKNERTPLIPACSATAEQIIRTHELVKLDSDQTYLVGSAAMTLYGIELSTYDPVFGTYNQRPGDLDFAASPLYMNKLFASGSATGLFPTKKDVASARQTVIHFDAPILSVDVISRYQNTHDLGSYSQKFLNYLEVRSRPVKGSDLRVITPSALLKELSQNSSDPKARQDLASARRHFAK